jgi:hypothetical protein
MQEKYSATNPFSGRLENTNESAAVAQRFREYQSPRFDDLEDEPKRPGGLFHVWHVKAYLTKKFHRDHAKRLADLTLVLNTQELSPVQRDRLEFEKNQLEDELHRLQAAIDACENFKCDPSKYESFLFEDLAQAKKLGDEKKIHKLRGLIRAGSWASYPPIRGPEELRPFFAKIRLEREEYWNRLQAQETDETNKFILEHQKREEAELLGNYQAKIEKRAFGTALEDVAQFLEELSEQAWLEYKKALAGGVSSLSAEEWKKEIDALRPPRDYVLHRRLYPADIQKMEGVKKFSRG